MLHSGCQQAVAIQACQECLECIRTCSWATLQVCRHTWRWECHMACPTGPASQAATLRQQKRTTKKTKIAEKRKRTTKRQTRKKLPKAKRIMIEEILNAVTLVAPL